VRSSALTNPADAAFPAPCPQEEIVFRRSDELDRQEMSYDGIKAESAVIEIVCIDRGRVFKRLT
jgi:hypothetical protein